MKAQASSALVSSETLAVNLGKPHLKIVDSSWHMPAEKRDAFADYKAAHIPGAVFFDIDTVCDRSSSYPHMLPSTEEFAAAVGTLGIGDADEIVVYDSSGLFSAARLWWMFRVFGHERVSVLDGGLPKWKAENRKLESGNRGIAPAVFHALFQPSLLRTLNQIRSNITTKRELVLDARSPGRFTGQEPEPRRGLESGHIEGSANVFFKDMLALPYSTLKASDDLRKLLAGKSIDPGQPIAVTCGSGVTACILALALYELGNKTIAVYDGAWAEWGSA